MSHIHGVGKVIQVLIKDLPDVDDKNPIAAGIIGFLFGGVGLGLYFLSWRDFVYPLAVVFLAMFMMGSILPVIGVIPGWLLGSIFTAGWGIWRANGGGG